MSDFNDFDLALVNSLNAGYTNTTIREAAIVQGYMAQGADPGTAYRLMRQYLYPPKPQGWWIKWVVIAAIPLLLCLGIFIHGEGQKHKYDNVPCSKVPTDYTSVWHTAWMDNCLHGQ